MSAVNCGAVELSAPARCMRVATDSLARSLAAGAHTIKNSVGTFAEEFRGAGMGARNVDGNGANVIDRMGNTTRSRGPWLIGWDASMRHYTFEPHQVRSMRMVDHEGNLIGVSFPTQDGSRQGISDYQAYSTWSRMPNRLSDKEYIPNRGAIGRAPGPALPAPWADDAREGMLYVHSHSGPRGFEIKVNVGTDQEPDWRVLLVPGPFFGHVLAANRHFQAASRAGPGKPLLMLACHAGDPEYGHAARTAEVLHRAGMNHDVYATVDINRARWATETGTAMVYVDVPPGTEPSDAITVIRAPRSRSET